MLEGEETTDLPVRIEKGVVVCRDRNQSVQEITATFFGYEKKYFVSDHVERAAVVVVRDGCVLMTRQYRLLINAISTEIPGGRINEGEFPADAAARECYEETGVYCAEREEC